MRRETRLFAAYLNSLWADGHLYLALLIALMIVNLLPPVPAEMVIPLSATLFEDSSLSVAPAIVAATIGLVLGTMPLYYLGRGLGENRLKQFLDRYSRWLIVTSKDIDRSQRWFDRYGGALVLVGRLVPGIRSMISIPAGFHGMRLPAFLIWTTLGSAAWASLLIVAGHWLSHTLPRMTSVCIALIFVAFVGIFYIYRVSRR